MTRPAVIRVALALGAAFVCGILVARMKGRVPPGEYQAGFDAYAAVPPDRIGWSETQPIPLPPGEARAVAAGPQDLLVVGIDDRIIFLRGGSSREIRASGPVMCLAISTNGLIAAGLERSVSLYDTGGNSMGNVTGLDARSQVSAVAFGEDAIFIADFGLRRVWKAGLDGAVAGQYAGPDPNGFVIPSPYFDVAATAGGLWVVNPGMHELILLDNNLAEKARWRREGLDLDRFMGCCNPSHIAPMPCGGVVTSEKGLARIKLYSRDGALIDVVAPPAAFPGSHGPFDLTADAAGRLYVLDARRRQVRVFEHLRPCGEVGRDEP